MDDTKALIDKQPTWFWLGAVGLSLALFLFLFAWPPHEASQEEHHEHEHMSMPMDQEMNPSMQAKLLADKKESEFNHHLAGFFVVLAGVFISLQSVLVKGVANGEICVADMFPALGNFRAGLERHRVVAVWTRGMARCLATQSGGAAA